MYWNEVLKRRISRRRAIAALGGTAAAAAFLAACGGDGEEPASGGSGDTTSGSSGSSGSGGGAGDTDVKRGGDLRVGYVLDLITIDPHVPAPSADNTLWPVYETLTRADNDAQVQGILAESWEIADEGATLIFKMRPGVKFHDGRDLTAEDVVRNFDRIANPDLGYGRFALYTGWFDSVESPEAGTVVMRSSLPRPGIFDFLETWNIADMDTVDSENVRNATGPWKYSGWNPGEFLNLERNENYWNEGVPYLDKVSWKLALDADTMLAFLESGELDMALAPPINRLVQYQDGSDFQTFVHPAPSGGLSMGINFRYPPMEDDRVRRAMNWAFDRERYQNLIMKDIIEHTCLPWFSKTSLAYNEDQAQHYTLDLEEAAKLLSAANAEVSTTMLYRASNLAEFIPIYQEDLRQIGVNLELNFVDAAAFAAGVNDFSFRLFAGGSGNNGPTHPSTIFSSSSGSWSADGNNYFAYENARHQELIEQGALEFDPDRIRSIYWEINELLLASSHQMVAGAEPLTLVMAPNVKGFGYNLKNNVDFERTWLDS